MFARIRGLEIRRASAGEPIKLVRVDRVIAGLIVTVALPAGLLHRRIALGPHRRLRVLGSFKIDALQEELDKHGRAGWELVNIVHATPTVSSPTLIFKKES